MRAAATTVLLIWLFANGNGEEIPGPNPPPATPVNFTGTVQPDRTVLLTWSANTESDLAGYLLYRGVLPDFPIDADHLWETIPAPDSTFPDGTISSALFYRLAAIDAGGHRSTPTDELSLAPTGIEESSSIPKQYKLAQNYPNPFNPKTTIRFTLLKAERVDLSIYNILGQKVTTLINGEKEAGNHQVEWDATDEKGTAVTSGIYFYRIETFNFRQVKRMLFLK